MNGVRTLVCCGACVLVGCLFPSFDELRSNDKQDSGSSGDDDDVAKEAGASSSSSSSSSSGSTSSSSSSGDGGSGKEIACNGACPVAPGTFCCTTIGGLSCQGTGTETFCTSVEGGEIFRCDGDEDCEAGQVCCFTVADKEAKCATTCAAQVLCNGPKATCPTGKSCTGIVEKTFKACQ